MAGMKEPEPAVGNNYRNAFGLADQGVMGDVSNLSPDTDSPPVSDTYHGVDLDVHIREDDSQRIGPWMSTVSVAAHSSADVVASVTALLIKREGIQVRDNKKPSLRMALKKESSMLTTMFAEPPIFHPHGHANSQSMKSLSKYFLPEDMQRYNDTGDAAEHPLNRAWILLIRDIEVDTEYRRLGIGGNMIRKMLQTVLGQCVHAGRPLFVAVQPKFVEELPYDETIQLREMIYRRRVTDVFWVGIGFHRFGHVFSGYIGPWHVWGTPLALPAKKPISIPDDVEQRSTRGTTPPAQPRPSPIEYSTEVFDMSLDPPAAKLWIRRRKCQSLRSLRLAGPRNKKSTVQHDDGQDDVKLFTDPDDPSLHPRRAHRLRLMIKKMDDLGLPYLLRPYKKEKQQTASTLQPTQQTKQGSALQNDYDMGNIKYFRDPDDPALDPKIAKSTREVLDTMDRNGVPYLLRPQGWTGGGRQDGKLPQQTDEAPRNPFKATAGQARIAPLRLAGERKSVPGPPKLPSRTPDAGQSVRFEPYQPGLDDTEVDEGESEEDLGD